MGKKFIVTAFGKDRPGIVADVSQVLYENGCNLEDTRMTNLSGEFSLLILFSGPAETNLEAKLASRYKRLESEKGISAYIRPVGTVIEKTVTSKSTRRLKIEGLDHTGIVYRISRFLADNNINIANLESTITYAPESGAPVYTMEIQIELDENASLDAIEPGLERLADELHVEIAVE